METAEKKEEIQPSRVLEDTDYSWLKYDAENDVYVVNTKDGDFELQEVEYEKVERAFKRGQAAKREQLAAVAESMVGVSKLGEMDIAKLKGSSVFRLIKTVNIIYGTDDLLLTQERN